MVLVRPVWISERFPNIWSLKNNSLNVLGVQLMLVVQNFRGHCFLVSRVWFSFVFCHKTSINWKMRKTFPFTSGVWNWTFEFLVILLRQIPPLLRDLKHWSDEDSCILCSFCQRQFYRDCGILLFFFFPQGLVSLKSLVFCQLSIFVFCVAVKQSSLAALNTATLMSAVIFFFGIWN